MAALRVCAIVVGLCLYFSYGTLGQQCDQAIQDFHQCTFDSFKKPSGQQGQGRPNFDDLKQKADDCFTSNNCEAPKLNGPPSPGSRPNGGPPAGGRAGRVGGSSGPNADNSDRRKCFDSVNNKTKDAILTCIRKSDPTFTFPSKDGDHHGPGFGGPRPGGPGGDRDGPQRGPGGDRDGPQRGPGGRGPGGPPGRFGRGQQFLLDACKNNADAASKVNACLANIFPQRPQRPSNDQLKQGFEERCKAKSACEAKLGSACKVVLEKRHEAMCTCGQEASSRRQEFQQQEPACASLPERQGGGSGGSKGGSRQRQKQDCSQKRPDPCAQGFEASLQNVREHRQN